MKIKLFESKKIRSEWNDEEQKWYFSIVDVISTLTESVDSLAYWRKLKERLKKEGNQTVTDCHALKMEAADGRMRLTDVADTERVLMYWHIGQRIFLEEQEGKDRADYGKFLIKTISEQLKPQYGSGFSSRQLERYRQFYRLFPIASTFQRSKKYRFDYLLYTLQYYEF